MTYEEFMNMLAEPIDGKFNSATEVARLAVFCYSLSKVVSELNEKVDNLEKKNSELKRFVRRNVEPDLSYMG